MRPSPLVNEVETDETELERCQRNFSELLQELRVAQAGVQILFAFLLSLAFTGRLVECGPFVAVTYVVALLSAGIASALLIAPVAQHRMLFRLGRKPYLVRSSHRMAAAGLGLLLVSMVSSVLLASDAVLPRAVALAVAAIVGVAFVALWAVAPWVERRPTPMEVKEAALARPSAELSWGCPPEHVSHRTLEEYLGCQPTRRGVTSEHGLGTSAPSRPEGRP